MASAMSVWRRSITSIFKDEHEEGDSSVVGNRPMFAISNGYANYHVRLKDVREYFVAKELKRKRRVGFQLEFIFLVFFIPFCISWNASFGQFNLASVTLALSPFPSEPIFPPQTYSSISFKTFAEGFSSNDEVWQWINNVLYKQIFLDGECGLSVGGNSDAIVAGLVRIRQVRVVPRSCPQLASKMGIVCYPEYQDDLEATRPIAGIYEYQSSAATTELDYFGDFTKYPGSGFAINLTTGGPPGTICNLANLTQASQLLQARLAPFVDEATRALVITVTALSPSSGTLVTIRMAIEFSYSGVIWPSMNVAGARFYRTSADSTTIQALSILVAMVECVFVLSSIWGLVFAWKIDSYVWTVTDLATSALMIYQLYLVLSFLYSSDYVAAFEDSINQASEGAWSGSGFYSGAGVKAMRDVPVVNGMILLLSALRLFRYSQYLDFMGAIHGTFRRTFWDIILYLFLLCLLSLGFVLCGVVVLGYNLIAFRTYANAVFTIMQYYLLTIDYYTIAKLKPLGLYIAPIFLSSFILIFTWYMFSVFIAIIYVGYRVERNAINKQRAEKDKWIKEAEKHGILCPKVEEANQPLKRAKLKKLRALSDTGDDDAEETVVTTTSTPATTTRFGGVLLTKDFFFVAWSEYLKELFRQFLGMSDRPGFKDYTAIIEYLREYEDNLKKNLLSPGRRFYVSFSELMDIVNGRSLDLLEELKRTQNDAAAAEEYRRLRQGKVTDIERLRYQEDLESPDDPDAYLYRMDPVEIQLSRLFRELYIVPEDKVDVIARTEADESGGQIKRSLLVRIEQSSRILDEREAESNRVIIGKIKAMRVVQQTMERDLRSLRDLLK